MLEHQLNAVTKLLQQNQVADAQVSCQALVKQHPMSQKAWLLYSNISKRQGRFNDMLTQAESALALDSENLNARFQVVEGQIYCGQVNRAVANLQAIEARRGADSDHALQQHIASFYSHCSRHQDATRCHRRALILNPANAGYRYNLAAALIALGEMEEAETLLTEVINTNPRDFDAYQNRSTLRKQTPDNNHIDELKARLDQNLANVTAGQANGKSSGEENGEAQLCYALSKEYEDLGEHDQAFTYLQRGAAKRRSKMRYQVESDLVAIERIIEVFDRAFLSRELNKAETDSEQAATGLKPIFVIGLPRSGTTLVDRIVSSHSDVISLGEINDFAFSLMRTIGSGGSKLELIEQSAQIDYSALGDAYVSSARNYEMTEPAFIDKTPLNFLYLGLIHLSLPQARVIHLRRNPMDSCYAMYKTLFRMGYPFSYDLTDITRYYLAYRRLMDHWRALIPNAFLDVDYEELVVNQELVSREIIDYCGLEWQDNCLHFYRNTAPAATASAAQVRQPVYTSSLQRWRSYQKQLEPLAQQLSDGGVAID